MGAVALAKAACQTGYRLDGDALTAWIRGTQKGRDRRVEFPYRRTRCTSQ